MRILYDGHIFKIQRAGGINRYFANLIDGLPADISPTLATSRVTGVHWPQNPKLKILRYKGIGAGSVLRNFEEPYLNLVTGRYKYDVFHPTYYTSFVRRKWSDYRCPAVLTIYDIIHEKFAAMMDPTGLYAEEKRQAIIASQAIICISENTKNDVIDYYSVPESKITVIHLAADLSADFASGPEVIPDHPYFLYVGNRAPYKNFDSLLFSLSQITKTQREIALCVVGSPFSDDERKMISRLGLSENICQYPHVSDAHLAKLYRWSLALVYPSLYEGFGIPPLEAMQCGTLVVASNTSSIPEVVGDAGILFDPRSTGELSEILLSISNDTVDRKAIIEKGYRRAKEFRWDKTISQTVKVYRSLTS